MIIDSLEQLRSLYAHPQGRTVTKQLSALDRHCRAYIGLAPFLVVASGDPARSLDASPRGGAPGFVKVLDEHTLLIPDSPGNNRLDTLENIVASGRVGLLFMIPGVDETLRINGRARLSCREEHVAACSDDRRRAKLAIEVQVEEAYLHCAKALMRSQLWAASSRQDRAVLPTMSEMLNSQTGVEAPLETQAEMARRYMADL